MGALFGKHKKTPSRITEQDKAILQLKQQRDKLKQFQKRIELSLEKDRELAKKCLLNGRKDRAKCLLRKKKYQEQLLKNTDAQLENLEKMAMDIEFAQVEIQVMDGLKQGNLALKKVHEVLTLDEIEQILDDTREAVDKQNEIDSLLTGVLSQEDENAVEEELNMLMELEELDENVEVDINLPDVPSEELPQHKEKAPEKQRIAVALES
ncbi:charged multivesicular body protein 6-like [Ctenocephalides felis]|uniref:charged multivesicular body protein 6-like n=1 Tax=Ctenocephalides felis TaxID=7515 RepID=UPI000E6E3D7D|nr:charged multivesicular body protein 6-like [Ctenocephalides felis]